MKLYNYKAVNETFWPVIKSQENNHDFGREKRQLISGSRLLLSFVAKNVFNSNET